MKLQELMSELGNKNPHPVFIFHITDKTAPFFYAYGLPDDTRAYKDKIISWLDAPVQAELSDGVYKIELNGSFLICTRYDDVTGTVLTGFLVERTPAVREKLISVMADHVFNWWPVAQGA